MEEQRHWSVKVPSGLKQCLCTYLYLVVRGVSTQGQLYRHSSTYLADTQGNLCHRTRHSDLVLNDLTAEVATQARRNKAWRRSEDVPAKTLYQRQALPQSNLKAFCYIRTPVSLPRVTCHQPIVFRDPLPTGDHLRSQIPPQLEEVEFFSWYSYHTFLPTTTKPVIYLSPYLNFLPHPCLFR